VPNSTLLTRDKRAIISSYEPEVSCCVLCLRQCVVAQTLSKHSARCAMPACARSAPQALGRAPHRPMARPHRQCRSLLFAGPCCAGRLPQHGELDLRGQEIVLALHTRCQGCVLLMHASDSCFCMLSCSLSEGTEASSTRTSAARADCSAARAALRAAASRPAASRCACMQHHVRWARAFLSTVRHMGFDPVTQHGLKIAPGA